ncbi:anterior gradient protein 2 homolog [Amia ocellicauda]|uniref:anterior gradient protein 2 homolog n=1 Tax=Amia ocellicauda TaxID=2972642 RepID=UPI0034642E35
MKSIVQATLFVLVCVGTYYVYLAFQAPKDTLSVTKLRQHQTGKKPPKRSSHPPKDIPPPQSDILQKPKDVPKPPKDTPDLLKDIPDLPKDKPDLLKDIPDLPKDKPDLHKDIPDLPKDKPDLPKVTPPPPITVQSPSLSRGWGDEIHWIETYNEALLKAKSSQKPLMVIHHLEQCPVCKKLKAVFSTNEAIQKMAKENFIMFNIMNETGDKNLAPDGYYVPRIMFIDPSLTIRLDITGKRPQHKYTYFADDIPLLLENMQKAKLFLNTEL